MKIIKYLFVLLYLTGVSFSQYVNQGFKVYDKVKSAIAIVYVYDDSRNLIRLGAGFTYTADGQVVTSFGLTEGGKYVKIKVNDREYIPSKIYKYDRRRDVVVYKIDNKEGIGFPYLNVANSDEIRVGEQIFIMGNPKGFERSLLEAIISSKRDFGAGKVFFQLSGAAVSGLRGSPLLNSNGDVIGLMTSKNAMPSDISFATQINSVKQLLESASVKNYSVPDYFDYKQDPTNYDMGIMYESRGDHSSAIWYYLRSLKDNVTSDTYRRLAYCHEQLGNLQSAEDYYRKAKEVERILNK